LDAEILATQVLVVDRVVEAVGVFKAATQHSVRARHTVVSVTKREGMTAGEDAHRYRLRVRVVAEMVVIWVRFATALAPSLLLLTGVIGRGFRECGCGLSVIWLQFCRLLLSLVIIGVRFPMQAR
jgi:hypothetical protein